MNFNPRDINNLVNNLPAILAGVVAVITALGTLLGGLTSGSSEAFSQGSSAPGTVQTQQQNQQPQNNRSQNTGQNQRVNTARSQYVRNYDYVNHPNSWYTPASSVTIGGKVYPNSYWLRDADTPRAFFIENFHNYSRLTATVGFTKNALEAQRGVVTVSCDGTERWRGDVQRHQVVNMDVNISGCKMVRIQGAASRTSQLNTGRLHGLSIGDPMLHF